MRSWNKRLPQPLLRERPTIPSLVQTRRRPLTWKRGQITVRDPETLFTAMGCLGCHNLDLPQDDDNKGPVGPNLGNINEVASNRVVGQDAEQYVNESITQPNNYIVTGYNSGIMPQNFSEQMSQEEISGLVTWLLAR